MIWLLQHKVIVQGSANHGLQLKSGLLPVFVSKVDRSTLTLVLLLLIAAVRDLQSKNENAY
jgi:hypothetical protein